MSRTALFAKSKLIVLAVPLVVAAGVIGAVSSYNASPKPQITTQQSLTTDVKYRGVEGNNALELLKKYASVQTKHYSFGDLVTSINGTPGNSPKYWSFYVNGKMSDVGASTYMTHKTDNIEWKLQ